MIDVIIPTYEAHDFLAIGLHSLACQTFASKLHVYIVDDCSSRGYEEIVKPFRRNLKITILKTPYNSGPGFARQYGIDHSDSPYITFMDADDVFYYVRAIQDLYEVMENNSADEVIGNFAEELANGTVYIHYCNDVWMHGKMYRRSFLEENNIRMNNTAANEDTGFNQLTRMVAKNIQNLDQVVYYWKVNPNSICRQNNNEYSFGGLKGFIYNMVWAVKEAEKRDSDVERRGTVVIQALMEIYYNYLRFSNRPDAKKLIRWSCDLKDLYDKYIQVLSNEAIKNAYRALVNKGAGMVDPVFLANNKYSFDDFLKDIDKVQRGTKQQKIVKNRES